MVYECPTVALALEIEVEQKEIAIDEFTDVLDAIIYMYVEIDQDYHVHERNSPKPQIVTNCCSASLLLRQTRHCLGLVANKAERHYQS